MTNWAKLQDAYGSAAEIPHLLAELTPSQESDVWDELWGRLCHQGTVYSASFAALPLLTEAAAKWPPRERLMALSLCSRIIAARNGASSGEELRSVWEPLLPRLKGLAEESLGARGWSYLDYIYLLIAWLSFSGEWFWAACFQDVADQEASLACPTCGGDALISIAGEGSFAANEHYAHNSGVTTKSVTPAETESLSGISLRLYDRACSCGQAGVAAALLHLCGKTHCPGCGTEIPIIETLEAQKKLI